MNIPNTQQFQTTIASPWGRLVGLFLLMLLPLMASAAKQPTDDQLKALCRELSIKLQSVTSEEEADQALATLSQNLEKQADLSKISAQQVDMIFDFGGITLAPYLSKWLAPTLDAKAEKEHGIFAFLAWKYMPRKDDFHVDAQQVAALSRFLNDSQLQKILDQNPQSARDIISGIGSFKEENWATEGFHASAVHFLKCNLSDAAVGECVKVFNSVVYAEQLSKEAREEIRTLVLAQYKKLVASTDNQRIKKNSQTEIDYLEGPFAKGTLVGGKAPELHFLRVMKAEGDSVKTIDLATLSQLYSNPAEAPVVMLDFWGTKCVPCLQSFPELAEIQQHFEGKNVVILGITSLQGYFVDTPNHRTIQCRNNPEKELSLFPDFMKAMGMNWTVGISEENVMNTDYGALAIPHIVLIDKHGNVRHNCLQAEKEQKIELIEELLGE